MNELESARNTINRIDGEMAKLFEERMGAAALIADYKSSRGLSVRDSAREAALIERNKTFLSDPALLPYYEDFIRNVIDLSCRYQTRRMGNMRVAYCGATGAFAYIAAKQMFPHAELFPLPDFGGAYRAVETGEFDCAVLPLENSYAGEVGTVMDLMFAGSLHLNQVTDVPIVHHLMAVESATEETVKTVISHPQALEQCEKYLRRKGYQTRAYSNTALAAKYIKETGDPAIAALASDETAKVFGLKILESEVNDSHSNVTRFGAFSRTECRPLQTGERGGENSVLLFTVPNTSGALAKALNIIGAHGYNMRNLRSRPLKDRQWNYYFYMEIEGQVQTENGRNMLRELGAVCAKLQLVGTYHADNLQ